MKKQFLCTLGPASLKDGVIARLEEIGVELFRVNLSHTRPDDIAAVLRYVQSRTSVPICLDTEGAQVRTGLLTDGEIHLRENSVVRVHRDLLAGDSYNFSLYPRFIVNELREGDFVSMDASVLAQVIGVEDGAVAMRVLRGGKLGQNKAVTIERDIPMPPLTQKDIQALAIGKELGIRHVALSFANRASDVDEIRTHCLDPCFVISKIECRAGLENLEEITARSDALLIDRGDLSRQVPVEQIPRVQKSIIRRAQAAGVRVYVATNLMESMVTSPFPTRAEVNDVYNTLGDGADGLVLAAETAIGAYPVGCAGMIVRIVREFESSTGREDDHLSTPPISLLVEPLGGQLVRRVALPSELDGLGALPSLTVSDTDLMDCELIADGTYSPLTGFMCRDQLAAVLETNRLPSGLPWTMPILLQVDPHDAGELARGDTIALKSHAGVTHAIMEVRDIFSFDFERTVSKWFGTTSRSHPGVARIAGKSTVCVGGDVTLVEPLESSLGEYRLRPSTARFVFTRKGWSKVIGFHSRNVPHRVHEFIQLKALEDTHADGLFISPVIGAHRVGDFLPAPIMRSYQLLISAGYYPPGQVVLGCFATYPRYCGPREALFTAICRKNMGCSHFIVGRDHAGVGNFYTDEQTRSLFASLGDVGVQPIFFDTLGYDPEARTYTSATSAETVAISASRIRDALRGKEELPDWFMRDLVVDMLRSALESGEELFVTAGAPEAAAAAGAA